MTCEPDEVLNEPDIYREWAPPPEWSHALVCCWEQQVTVDRRGIDGWIRSIEPSARASAAVDLLATRAVDAAARQLGVTGRQLRRIVLAEVGLPPRVYQQVLRLQRFVRAADAGVPLARAAIVAGYADQPHLTRDVRRFSGLTPARLIRERRST
jgi:AraC-like DNA-binding protein